jgi:hypothetical protein
MNWMRRGRGVRRQPGVMNRLEAEYAALLESERIAGRVEWWKFDAVKLRLADKTFYTPDFVVLMKNGDLEVHEVKGGFIEDDAMVKLKVAAETFPLRFVMCQKKRKNDPWIFKEI